MAAPRTELGLNDTIPAAKNIYTAAAIAAQEDGNSIPPFDQWLEESKARLRAVDKQVKRGSGDIPG